MPQNFNKRFVNKIYQKFKTKKKMKKFIQSLIDNYRKSKSLKALRQPLIELSKSNTVHYEVTTEQIEKKRLAIMQLEGVNLDDFLAYEPKLQQVEAIGKRINLLNAEREELHLTTLRLKDQISKLEERLKSEVEAEN